MYVRGVLTIASRELIAAFARPVAPVVLGLFVGLFALFTLWFDDVLQGGIASMRGPFAWLALGIIFVVPATTMGSWSRDGGAHDVLLGSLPIEASGLVLGKWLAAVGLMTLALGLTWPWPVLLAVYGDLELGPMLGGYLGLWLAGVALAGVGSATSALARSQVVAFVVAFALGLVPWAMGYALPAMPVRWLPLLRYLTFEYHFANLASGVLDSRSLVFFVAITAVALRVAVHLVERRRLA